MALEELEAFARKEANFLLGLKNESSERSYILGVIRGMYLSWLVANGGGIGDVDFSVYYDSLNRVTSEFSE